MCSPVLDTERERAEEQDADHDPAPR